LRWSSRLRTGTATLTPTSESSPTCKWSGAFADTD
jgi:hypothetical protein